MDSFWFDLAYNSGHYFEGLPFDACYDEVLFDAYYSRARTLQRPFDLTAAAVLNQGVNSTSGNLNKLEESLNSIHISRDSNIRIDETREPIAIVNTAEVSIEGGGQTIPKGEQQPVGGGDHDRIDDD